MLQAPDDHILDRVTHLVPGSVERLGGFFPRKFACPTGQEEHVGPGQLVLAIAPWNLLHHHHAAISTVDAPHLVQQENQNPPERDELEASLRKMIVTRRRLVATRADRRRTLPRRTSTSMVFLSGLKRAFW